MNARNFSALVVVGTKAQFIKTAPVLAELSRRGLDYHLVYTGQHSETFELLERAFGTRPADDIVVPRCEASTHFRLASWAFRFWIRVVPRLRARAWRTATVGIVHGDTVSTLFGAIALRLAGIPVAHVEAGLRSPHLLDPFPEEVIRRLVSRVSQIHLAPDPLAVSNLDGSRGIVVSTGGNTLRDAINMALQRLGSKQAGGAGGYGVVSLHRNENLSKRATFELLMREIESVAHVSPLTFVLHPATRERLLGTSWWDRLCKIDAIRMIPRMDYPDFVELLLGASFLLTDGGSNQEEAAMLGLPTMLMRRFTERSDGLGSTVEMFDMSEGKALEFATKHAGASWPIKSISDDSPSARVVDALIGRTQACA